ncbi:elongation of very long chain fatty acids protein-like [Rhagoletis pomonella]|uniref:elongation of very long chain fatty acids protein-like n=1 Tax=Rhagoletis pomonella TaxID=28610 RepID=UPI00177D3E4C|nr:elongation of very long chain fatty acids protein-like [Rhagoletis pomonella]
MSQILRNIFHEYDPIASQLPFLGSPVPILTLTLCYLAFVLIIGPVFMRNRKPFNIKSVILVYNFLQVIVNCWLSYVFVATFYTHRAEVPDFGCLTKFQHSPKLEKLNVYGVYAFYMLKVIDYIETVFFVLRKSFKQVSFLHVYHHIMMSLFLYYLGTYYGSAGQYASVVALNCAVHAFMYTYYFVSALQPNMKLGLWWKKYITILQLSHFVLVLFHHSYPLLFRPKCDFPKGLLWFAVCQALIMLWLFGNFYRRTYMRVGQTGGVVKNGGKSVKNN